MSATRLLSNNIQDTLRIATVLAGAARAGDCITLSGEVGAGKTTFSQGFIGALLAKSESITSPTFTLVQSYEGKNDVRIMHADLYRLKHGSEFQELGLDEAFDNSITLIEWPEIAVESLPKERLRIEIEHISDDSRALLLYSASERWNRLLKTL